MSRLTVSEHLRISALMADRRRRELLSRAMSASPFRWRQVDSRVEQLLLVPQDIRTPDPSFWLEVRQGQFGLAGSIAKLDGRSPFDLRPPSPAWERALHGFGWLRHLHAAEDPDASEAARRLAMEWAIRFARGGGPSWNPETLARRTIAWISHANCLLEGADERAYEVITRSLSAQLSKLASVWREAGEGLPRLKALIALVLADLCVAGHDRRLPGDLAALLDELDRQVLPDGGHASRNPTVLIDVLIDLLPLRECFRARGKALPERVSRAIDRMLAMLGFMRLGDGLLARFNGVGVAFPAGLATVLAYADVTAPPLIEAPQSAYVRLSAGSTVLIADCGGPAPLALAGAAGAGCASFELSSGREVILANGGVPGSANLDWLPAARATASHNTLVLGEESSARLIVDRRLETLLREQPLRGPDVVEFERFEEVDGGIGFDVTHDGYLQRHGVLHHRRVTMDASGKRIVGIDRLRPPRGVMRHSRDVPFAIHFHLHPGVTCERADKLGTARIVTPTQNWRFAAEGARLGIEESKHFADSIGPLRTVQIVLRGASYGEVEVRWALTRLA